MKTTHVLVAIVCVFALCYAPMAAAEPCPNECSLHGTCRMGVCECFPGYTYFDCSLLTCPQIVRATVCVSMGHAVANQAGLVSIAVPRLAQMTVPPMDIAPRLVSAIASLDILETLVKIESVLMIAVATVSVMPLLSANATLDTLVSIAPFVHATKIVADVVTATMVHAIVSLDSREPTVTWLPAPTTALTTVTASMASASACQGGRELIAL